MSTVQLKIKKLRPGVKTPTKATDGSAAWDVYAPKNQYEPGRFYVAFKQGDRQATYGLTIPLGFAVEIPKHYCLLLCARSSFGRSYNGGIPHGVGVIDSDYRGEVQLTLCSNDPFAFEEDQRIGQLLLVPAPEAEWIEVDELSETARGTGGFGSTGK